MGHTSESPAKQRLVYASIWLISSSFMFVVGLWIAVRTRTPAGIAAGMLIGALAPNFIRRVLRRFFAVSQADTGLEDDPRVLHL